MPYDLGHALPGIRPRTGELGEPARAVRDVDGIGCEDVDDADTDGCTDDREADVALGVHGLLSERRSCLEAGEGQDRVYRTGDDAGESLVRVGCVPGAEHAEVVM